MTVYVAQNNARKKEIVTLLACPNEKDLTTGDKINAVVECQRVRANEIVEVDELPLDKTSFYSYVLNIKLKVVRVLEKS
jgi:hypothetical protein